MKEYYKLRKMFQITYTIIFFITTFLIVGRVEGSGILSIQLLIIYIISTILTIGKFLYSKRKYMCF